MKTSFEGLNEIKRHEGFVDHVYPDAKGRSAIGYGHNLHPGESFPGKIDQAKALDLLAGDVEFAEHAIDTLVKVPLSQSQYDALVSFIYNVGAGRGGFATSTMLKRLNEGKYQQAADQFLVWNKSDGKMNPGLVGRRKEERALFLRDMTQLKAA